MGTLQAKPQLMRGCTGLANLAERNSITPLVRVEEVLKALEEFSPEEEEHRRKLMQALELLRYVSKEDLRSEAGLDAYNFCSEKIEQVFRSALQARDEKEANGALWLAGRLPELDDAEEKSTLQDALRQLWDKARMEQAFQQAAALVPRAPKHRDVLEELMEVLDLAEFHAALAHDSARRDRAVQDVLSSLKPGLQVECNELLKSEKFEDLATILNTLGAARIDAVGMQSIRMKLQVAQSIKLLRQALSPVRGQVGISSEKQREIRHAVLTVKTVLNDDWGAAGQVKQLLLFETLPGAIMSDHRSAAQLTVEVLQTAFSLKVASEEEVWAAAHTPFDLLTNRSKNEMVQLLRSKHWGGTPAWLLTAEQDACVKALTSAMDGGTSAQLTAALVKVKDTDGGREACSTTYNQALRRLHAQHHLPDGWDVERMLVGQHLEKKLIAKTELIDGAVLRMVDDMLKNTTRPDVRTRDRKGTVPSSFIAVNVVQVMNASTWSSYVARRDEIAMECRKQHAGWNEAYWRDHLNGPIVASKLFESVGKITKAPDLRRDANEMWMLHGTNHAAADIISSDDFDMARANPSGLFGAGLYFAESISKSDEYVGGKVVNGDEIFPLLICRVCLGNVSYCDERRPDRKALEDKCLRDTWHSVLGDRKKLFNTFREFVVYDNQQVFPAYIVYYKRRY